VDNPIGYGFRLVRAPDGLSPISVPIATAASFDVYGGAANVILRPGDPVYRLADGGVGLAAGAESSGGTATTPTGIVANVGPYWNAVTGRMELAQGLPSDVAWGTNMQRQSKLSYWPLEGCVFEIDADENDTAATLAAYQALIGQNCDHILCGTSGESYAKPRLDISGHAATGTLVWNIVGISNYFLNDPAEHYFKLLVKANLIAAPPFTTTGV